jgi:hydrogenase maturation protease
MKSIPRQRAACPAASPLSAATLILGVGNILLRDEGVGVHAVEALQEERLPADVEALDGGTLGMDLVDMMAGRQRLIVIDAVRAGSPPGTVHRLSVEDLLRPDVPNLSLHQTGVLEALQVARHMGCAPPEVLIIGVEPHAIHYGLELSDAVSAVLPEVVELALAEAGVARAQ